MYDEMHRCQAAEHSTRQQQGYRDAWTWRASLAIAHTYRIAEFILRDVVGPLHLDSSVVPREPTYAQPGRSASFASTIDTRRAPSMPLALRGEAISRVWLSDRQKLDSRCAIGEAFPGAAACAVATTRIAITENAEGDLYRGLEGDSRRYRAFR